MKLLIVCRLFVIAVLASTLTSPVAAQVGSEDPLQIQEHYELGKPRMTVYVLGASSAAGIWTVNTDISFVEFLALSAPDGIGVRSREVVQTETIELYRTDNTGRRLVYTQNLREVLRGTAPAPTLFHQDLIIFETFTRPRRRISFRTLSTAIGTTSSLLLLYLRLTAAGN